MAQILAWGQKVSDAFAQRVLQTGEDFPGLVPSFLMACMDFESGLNPAAKNPGSTATGLIQFMEGIAHHYGTSTSALAQMSAEKQFDYVWLYFRDAIEVHGPLRTLADTYMAILNPSAIGKPMDYVMWVSGSSAYAANAGLDANKDHEITKGEAVAKVNVRLAQGLLPANAKSFDYPAPRIPLAAKPQGASTMSLVSSAFHFVFDRAFASAARMAATATPDAAAAGIDLVQTTPMPAQGSPNSTAGQASPVLRTLEDDLNNVVMAFVKSTVDQLPMVGGVAEMTGLDQKAADAAKAMLVLGEQHALDYVSALFSAHHVAINSVTVGSQAAISASPQSSGEDAPH